MNSLPLQTPSAADVERTETAPPAFPPLLTGWTQLTQAAEKSLATRALKSGNFSLAIRKYDEAIRFSAVVPVGVSVRIFSLPLFLMYGRARTLAFVFLTFYHTS